MQIAWPSCRFVVPRRRVFAQGEPTTAADAPVIPRACIVLSRICAAPSARLGNLAFEGQGAFASQC